MQANQTQYRAVDSLQNIFHLMRYIAPWHEKNAGALPAFNPSKANAR